MADFIFRKYKHEDKEQVLTLLGSALWHFPYEERLAYFNWKYEDNPYTVSPLAFVCLDGNKIIAFRGYMMQPISFSGMIYYNVASGDTVTDSKYRRKGVFYHLTKFSIGELEKDPRVKVITNSSSGIAASNCCKKLGWIPLISRGHLFSFTWRSFITKQNIEFSFNSVKKNVRIELTKECRPFEMGKLALYRMPKNLITVYTDSNYISWRYANPAAQYFFTYLYQKEELKAYIILKRLSARKYDLVDYQYEEENQLRSMLFEIHRCLHPLYIINWIVNPNSIINRHPLRFGFVNLNFILNKISKFRFPPFLIRTTRVNQFEKDWEIAESKDMRNMDNWNVNKVIADEI